MHGRPPLLLFRTIARSPRAWGKFAAGSLLDRGPLSLRQREIVIDRTCALCGCEYEWGVHVSTFGKAAGLSSGDVRALTATPFDPTGWPKDEVALVAAVDGLHERATLSDDIFAELRAHFDEASILEIFMLAGFYRTVSYLANGLALPLEDGAARFTAFVG